MDSLPPRFSILSPPDARDVAIVEGAELHHMRDVMRLHAGDEVALLDRDGREHLGVIDRYDRSQAFVRITASRSPLATRLILAAAIIKGPRMDLVVEKAAELGASELWPTVCAHGLVKSPGVERLARWRRLALAAAKQSLTPRPMEVRTPIAFADLIRSVPADTLAIICERGCEPLGEVIRRLAPRAILIATGPEGDFDPGERAAAHAAGFVAAGLGSNRLRSETAAIAALSIAANAIDLAAR
ncbi:MAG: RsmE family RNA methyltransferase [Candidatus Binatus sp.]|uniref:RsmE family RNA methyltransferase n=1 Tax=Candidatus Binatus sp. TaxID=2811406 RepID=UPI00271CA4B3|nr:RsmE family RNA methyltransferase [Candidatus Binatus sp.]MDO8432710.1 RsmE family RNA methyltransferase [Candidatus Binatus sp.]